jgi:hypothetical protein
VPGHRGEVRIAEVGEQVRVQKDEHDIELAVLLKAGAADPAPSEKTDPTGYDTRARTVFAGIIDALLAGAPVA